MWEYSGNDSDSETSSSAYCNYCGQTCANRRHLKDDLGICSRCSRLLPHLTDGNSNNSRIMRTPEPEMSSDSSTPEDGDVGAISAGDSDDEVGSSSEISEDEEEVGDGDEQEAALCPRCWKNPPTTKLYDVPICEGCLRQAKQQKNLPPGSRKRRFQPPTPNLAPGKKLTRVCDTCRQRRKRCPHRRVVDEDDPDADPRSKRLKAEQRPEEDGDDEEDSESTLPAERTSSPEEKSDATDESGNDADEEDVEEDIGQEVEHEEEEDTDEDEDVDENANENTDENTVEEANGVDNVDYNEVPHIAHRRFMAARSWGGNRQNDDDYDCEETMRQAIKDSIDIVLGNEAQELIEEVQAKLETVKRNIGTFVSSQRGRGNYRRR